MTMGLILSCLAKSLAYYGLATVSLFAMSAIIPRAAFLARSLAAYLSAAAAAVYGIFSSVALALVGKQQIAQWATGRAFSALMRATTGTYFIIDDPGRVLDTTRPAVFIGNHQTELDILMLGALFPKYCSVTAKASLKWVPFLGWFMALSGTVFIDRANAKDARSAMDGAAGKIKSMRQSVYIFPEGTRSYAEEPVLLPFKKGAFHLAVQAGVPIVPCVVANYSHVFFIKGMRFNAGSIPVKILDPIPTEGLTAADVPELVKTTQELMLRELVALTTKARGQPMPVPARIEPADTAEIVNHEEKPTEAAAETVEASAQLSH
ncbi:putative 1-acyl-sn-glycerol-3-phosphate acyltransferase [Escovopsis weberi]|uniref:1-acyl-sn-glycerol-3-phosphate acyltransferase n=1 Tax=Escovopsis weberi TaxID=150374 RepID=A0A0M9VTW0_ESCWE|nr:putative 1-acyl-sn-glycerol-3-phosphate acyltransferase [Escovopsis weberi]